jgi:CRP-like cAMP-binding protein
MDYFQFSRIQLKLSSLLIMTLLISHIFACIFALIAKLNSLVEVRNDEYSYSWLASAGLIDEPWFVQYAAAMYFCVATITTVGYGDIVPQTTLEQLFVTLLMLFGGAFYGFIIASLAALLSSWDINKTKFDEKMDSISNYMKVRKFPTFLFRKIRTYYRHYYNKRTALDERAILSELSTQLRREVVDFMVSDVKGQILKEVPMFKNLDRIHLATLLTVLKPLTASPGEYIVKEGQSTEEMYILMSGTLHAKIDDSVEIVAELRTGACFGELAALGLKPICSTSMLAATYCELYSLSRMAIYEAFNNNFAIIDEMVEKAIDATMDTDTKDKKYRRESEKIMKEWSNSIGKSISDASTNFSSKNGIRGKSNSNFANKKKRHRSSPYLQKRRQSAHTRMDLDENFGDIDEEAILAVRAQYENAKYSEKQDTGSKSLATLELVELKNNISQGMEKMFKMMDQLKGEIEKIKLNNPPTSLTSPDN